MPCSLTAVTGVQSELLGGRQGSGFAPNLSTICPYELTWSAGKEQTRSVSCFDSYPCEFSLTVLFPLPFAENTAVLPDAPRAVSRKEAVCTSSSSQTHSCCTSNIYFYLYEVRPHYLRFSHTSLTHVARKCIRSFYWILTSSSMDCLHTDGIL